ncbi:transcriptional regulator [Thermobacillus composti KWC4]|uniref:Transcriptional regulator n=1 Tax=Thermobacillus composti (strain DSM 18247 / JCM 13945 / KWC4) TaxID=717605 RepID=L0EIY9_THECK|nr:LacI family DNA-binding transcriptional regulator [Thermobacillus composti]AGA59666.1 transcriptional regulator [Thermobacillus composti KWC4]
MASRRSEINSIEIARLAGVSRSTVSRVINNYPNVPPETREKVMRVIEKYNYFPNMSAQVLAGKKTRTIGLFLVGAGSVAGDIVANMLISGVIENASGCGYYVLTHILRSTSDSDAVKRVKEIFYQRRIDGGIFIGAPNEEPLIESLIAEGFAVGIVDQHLPGKSDPNRLVVNFDNATGMELAVGYLAELNHRDIGIINGAMNRYSGPDKYESFRRAMERRGLAVNPDWVLPGDFHEPAGYEAIHRLLACGKPLPTAIIAANDSVAFGAMRALREHGLRVPDDISLIGFDDHVLSAMQQPALTTVRVDFESLMKQLTDRLIRYIETGTPFIEPYVTSSELVIRDSCRRL